jgi:hypothetical protein
MSVIIDTSAFERQIAALAAQLPRDVSGPVLREEAGQFVRQVVRFLPPKTFAQGRQAVRRDILRAINSLPDGISTDPKKKGKNITNPAIRAVLLSGDLSAIRAMMARIPGFSRHDVRAFSPELHRSRRNRRGNVSKNAVPAYIAGRSAKSLLNNYIHTIQLRVGFLKSGYMPAARRLGVSLPAFVRRHPNLGQGQIDIRLNTGPVQEVVITNRAGRYPDHIRVVHDALRSRQQAMATKILRMTNGLALNLGFAKISGPAHSPNVITIARRAA